MTEGGKLFDDLKLWEPGSPLTEAQARAVWDTLSARFAAAAKGQMSALVSKGSQRSAYFRVEEPILVDNPNDTGVVKK